PGASGGTRTTPRRASQGRFVPDTSTSPATTTAVLSRLIASPSRRRFMSVLREGGCSCGAVRYRLASDPLFTHCCHCLNCQRQTGSAFVINLLIEADRVELL